MPMPAQAHAGVLEQGLAAVLRPRASLAEEQLRGENMYLKTPEELDRLGIRMLPRTLEEAIIGTLEAYGIKAGRIEGLTGVWLDRDEPLKARKICAFGIRASRWVIMHGFAFNVNTDLSYFGTIVPCGIADKGVTSLAKELGREVDIDEVKERLKVELANLFDVELVPSGA